MWSEFRLRDVTACLSDDSSWSWTIWVDLGRDLEMGRRRQQAITVRGTKKYTEKELRELLRSLGVSSCIKPSRVTLAQWLEEWCRGYVAMHCSTRMAESYQSGYGGI